MTEIYTDGVDRDGAGGGVLCQRLRCSRARAGHSPVVLGALKSIQGLLLSALCKPLQVSWLRNTRCQVTAGHVLVVTLPLGLAGLTNGEGVAARHPGNLPGAGVEVSSQTH